MPSLRLIYVHIVMTQLAYQGQTNFLQPIIFLQVCTLSVHLAVIQSFHMLFLSLNRGEVLGFIMYDMVDQFIYRVT